MHSTGIYQGQRATTDEKARCYSDAVGLRRPAAQQCHHLVGRYSRNLASFAKSNPSRPELLAFRHPYWNTDTGGFFGNRATGNGNPANPQFQELFTRWFEFGAFCPMFRVHSSSGLNPGREFYRFDEKTQKILRTYLDLRYRLLPYLYSVAWQVTNGGSRVYETAGHEFCQRSKVLDIGDQYLSGPSIMVAPVAAAGDKAVGVFADCGGLLV